MISNLIFRTLHLRYKNTMLPTAFYAHLKLLIGINIIKHIKVLPHQDLNISKY